MKKILPIFMSIFLLISGLGAVAIDSEVNELISDSVETEDDQKLDFTHTVFAEFGTSTGCGYCKYAHAALKNIYISQDYPFNYVSLVGNKNPLAYTRIDVDYNFYGYPTVWFDGGYQVSLGGGSGNEAEYRSKINTCGSRAVDDVEITVDVVWNGGTEMEITSTVINNQATSYGGYLRVYITELISSMGWYDTAGKLYTFPFLDWAHNRYVTVPALDTWTNTMTWDGATAGYPSVTEDNLMVIGTIFNDEWHQGYSYPPSSNPFDAYYLDDSMACRVGENRPPNTPSSPNPYNGETGVGINEDLSWTGTDPDWFDTLTYDVYFGTTSPPPQVEYGQEDTSYNPGILDYETTYYWKIVSWDNNGASMEGSIWSFTTGANSPPDEPDIEGETGGSFGEEYEYTFIATDPEDDDISYYVEWGDGTITDWTSFVESGDEITLTHTFEEEGMYTIKAKVKDTFEQESDWGYLEVEMPISYHFFLQRFFDRFPNAFPLIKHILGL